MKRLLFAYTFCTLLMTGQVMDRTSAFFARQVREAEHRVHSLEMILGQMDVAGLQRAFDESGAVLSDDLACVQEARQALLRSLQHPVEAKPAECSLEQAMASPPPDTKQIILCSRQVLLRSVRLADLAEKLTVAKRYSPENVAETREELERAKAKLREFRQTTQMFQDIRRADELLQQGRVLVNRGLPSGPDKLK